MKTNLTILPLALATMLTLTGCTTVVEEKPAVTSTTVTEERSSLHPMSGVSATQTTTTTRR